MLPYWLMYVLAALGVLACLPALRGVPAGVRLRLYWFFVIALFTLMIGLRERVGGDWDTYAMHFARIGRMSLSRALGFDDPGYYFLNWVVARAGGSVYWVNFICALLVMWGVSYFSGQQPLPWLALLVSVPYLLIVVAMGYSRQAAALGLALVALSYLGQGRTMRFAVFVLLGALFHKSAVLLLPIAALSATHSKMWTFAWVGVVAAAGAYFLVLDAADTLWQNYVEADYRSQGGLIRVAMNAVPATLLLMFRRYLFYHEAERKLWVWMAIFSLFTVPLVMLSSTAVDRVALYFIPLQLFVFSRLPFLVRHYGQRPFVVAGVVAYYALVQFVWLNYAAHAFAWLPYKNVLS